MAMVDKRLSHASLQQAAHWYVVLQEEGCSLPVREQWQRWLEQHSDHQAAWHYVQRVGERFAPLQGEGERVGRLLRDTDARRVSRRQGFKGLAVLGLGSMLGWGSWRTAALQGWTADLATGIGQIREARLADGTHLWLGARSAVDNAYTAQERLLHLRFGEVLIETAKDAQRPFVIDTPQGRMRALGTRFAVRQGEGSTCLNVYLGAVEVCTAGSGRRQVIEAGQRVTFTEQSISPATPAQTAGESWVHQVLTAEGMPLGELLEALGRYRHGHLGCDPAVASLSVMGTFPLQDTEQALRLLAAALPVRVERLTSWWVSVAPA